MIRTLWRNKILVLFIIALLVLFPAASIQPSQMLSRAVFVSVGIDYVNGEYVVTGMVAVNEFEPFADPTASKPVSATGETVRDALDNIRGNEGRKPSFSHCNLIVLGDGLRDKNVADVLGVFFRDYRIGNNVLLIYTEDDIMELLEISKEFRTESPGGLLETIAIFNKTATIDDFFKEYLRGNSPVSISIVNTNDGALDNTREWAVFVDGYLLSS